MKMVFPNSRSSRTFGDIASDVNTLVDTFLGAASTNRADAQGGFVPRMDIFETDDKFVVSLDIPGVKSSDVHIDLNEDHLVIHGSRTAAQEAKEDRYYRIERWSGEFSRSLRLPRSVDREGIAADYHEGVLSVSLPKSKASASRKIEIRSGEANRVEPSANDVAANAWDHANGESPNQ
jgi:HSP20 family protein